MPPQLGKAVPSTFRDEELYVETASSEHIEMYLKAVWLIEENGETPVRITSISKTLGVAAPSVVQMLRNLDGSYVTYLPRKGVKLTSKGTEIGRRMIRNTRLAELLMRRILNVNLDGRVVCGLEHHMSDEFAEALCTLLGHPSRCPHGHTIPLGHCCKG